MNVKWLYRYGRLFAVAFTLVLLLSATPAHACGCGGYIARDGDGSVAQEIALVRWDGQSEDIVMSFGMQGSSSEAAWIMPVPARATAKLADAKLFGSLSVLTSPQVQIVKRPAIPIMLGSSAMPEAGGVPVTLLDRQTLGPFEVSNLSASDAGALSDWLKNNGYNFPPKLAEALGPYVAQHWFYVAVRLRPGADTSALKGMLDPLWVTFASDTTIYPMRASRAASRAMPVTIYVLSDHRMQKTAIFGSSHVSYADWIDPSTLEANSPLAPFVTRKGFLTKFEDQVDPARIDNDFVFTQATRDETYHDVTVRYEDDYTLFFALCCCAPLLVFFGLIGAGILFLVRRKHAPAAV